MKFMAIVLFFYLATASAEGGVEKMSHTEGHTLSFIWHRGGSVRLNCPAGKSIEVNVNKVNDDVWLVKLGNVYECRRKWMPEHTDREDYVVEKHLLPLHDYKTPVVDDVIIVVPENQNDYVFIIYSKLLE